MMLSWVPYKFRVYPTSVSFTQVTRLVVIKLPRNDQCENISRGVPMALNEILEPQKAANEISSNQIRPQALHPHHFGRVQNSGFLNSEMERTSLQANFGAQDDQQQVNFFSKKNKH